jgi:hypothetical protein
MAERPAQAALTIPEPVEPSPGAAAGRCAADVATASKRKHPLTDVAGPSTQQGAQSSQRLIGSTDAVATRGRNSAAADRVVSKKCRITVRRPRGVIDG